MRPASLGITATAAIALAVVVVVPADQQAHSQVVPAYDGATVQGTLANTAPEAKGPSRTTRKKIRKSGKKFYVAPGRSGLSGPGKLKTFRVEVQRGIRGVSVDDFAAAVEDRLLDHRSWAQTDGRALQRVSKGRYNFAVTLAKPKTVDRLCYPLRTGGFVSCNNGRRAVINIKRWRHGAPDFPTLEEYRTYLINHEVGHGLGKKHWYCPSRGGPGRVMMQQTYTLRDNCDPQNVARPNAPQFRSTCEFSAREEDGRLRLDGRLSITPRPHLIEISRTDDNGDHAVGSVRTTTDGDFSTPVDVGDFTPSTRAITMSFAGDRDLAACTSTTPVQPKTPAPEPSESSSESPAPEPSESSSESPAPVQEP